MKIITGPIRSPPPSYKLGKKEKKKTESTEIQATAPSINQSFVFASENGRLGFDPLDEPDSLLSSVCVHTFCEWGVHDSEFGTPLMRGYKLDIRELTDVLVV